MEEALVNAIAQQVPDLVVLLIIVLIFIRYLERRDALYLDLVDKISARLEALSDAFTKHAEETSSGIEEMHRTVAYNRRRYERRKRQANI